MYADKITDSMRRMMESTDYRREKQLKYNEVNGITPTQIVKASRPIIGVESKRKAAAESKEKKYYSGAESQDMAADPVIQYMGRDELEKAIVKVRKEMEKCAKDLDFIQAAQYRDEMFRLKEFMLKKFGE